LAGQVAGDNGFVSIQVITDIVNVLAGQDASIDKSQTVAFLSKLQDVGS
jgi:hypothetical protein